MLKVGVDVMSGDMPPHELIKGCLSASKQYKNLHVFLVGDRFVIKENLERVSYDKDRVTVIHAKEVISMDEHPSKACRAKKDASVMVGCRGLKNGLYDSFFSPGNTGATLAAALLIVGRIDGVKRPAIMTPLPRQDGSFSFLLDAGANVDCHPRYLKQFAVMGYNYVKYVLGHDSPKIGLLSVGEESTKGNELTFKAYKILEKLPYNFIGNVEPADCLTNKVDVIVADGFVGNILLKSLETGVKALKSMIRKEVYTSFKYKVGAYFLKGMFESIKKSTDAESFGGANLIGVKKTIYIGHGSSGARAVFSALEICMKSIDFKIITHIEQDIEKWG